MAKQMIKLVQVGFYNTLEVATAIAHGLLMATAITQAEHAEIIAEIQMFFVPIAPEVLPAPEEPEQVKEVTL